MTHTQIVLLLVAHTVARQPAARRLYRISLDSVSLLSGDRAGECG